MNSFQIFRLNSKVDNVTSATYEVVKDDIPINAIPSINEALVRDVIFGVLTAEKAPKLLEAHMLMHGSISIRFKDKLFGVFGLLCKLIFHVIAVIIGVMYNLPLGILLICIFLGHNLVGIVYLKRYKQLQQQANIKLYGGTDD